MSEGYFFESFPKVPGRGFNTSQAVKLRQTFLRSLRLDLERLFENRLPLDEINHNIESFIGSVEIPVGLVGPIAFKEAHNELPQPVFLPAATTEGALVYSMNRGARLIALSGGFDSEFHFQRMLRAPMFILKSNEDASLLHRFMKNKFSEIKMVAESYSNHAKLLEIRYSQESEILHTKFYYSTGDAAGQNMTTTCTWHALLYIASEFEKLHPNVSLDYVIEGNGASDKKISQYNIENGRGCKVSASVEVSNSILKEVLRVNGSDLMKYFLPSKQKAIEEGMMGYNINVANALAAIFLATGQDAACLHESSTAFFNIEPIEDGLKFELMLPNLVIGTVGGGTHLPKQSAALQLMGCQGRGKLERFARIICGAALGLEISTFGAIVSGEFARSHQKLGRNKPVDWLLKSEITVPFLQQCVTESFRSKIQFVDWLSQEFFDNGIITQLTSKVTSKLQGYYLIKINDSGDTLLLKSRASSEEIFKGLHLMASSISAELAAALLNCRSYLEFKDCHLKELLVNQLLSDFEFKHTPGFFGTHRDDKREIYLIVQEFIHPSQTRILNSENSPEIWLESDVIACINAIHDFHQGDLQQKKLNFGIQEPWKANEFYELLNTELVKTLERNSAFNAYEIDVLKSLNTDDLKADLGNLTSSICLIHNDFNPRNIMILNNGKPVVYDWELCVYDFPHRDIIELLCFLDLNKDSFEKHIFYHSELLGEYFENYKFTAVYSLKSLILTRFSLYAVAGTSNASGTDTGYEFSQRVMKTALRYLEWLEIK